MEATAPKGGKLLRFGAAKAMPLGVPPDVPALNDTQPLEQLLRIAAEAPDLHGYWDAANAIAHRNSKRATRPLMAIARQTNEPLRRAAALHALWRLHDPRATTLFLAVAARRDTEIEKTRIIAVEALGISIRRHHVQRAVAGYLSDTRPALRYSALCAAGRAPLFGYPTLPVLEEALHIRLTDPDSVYEPGDLAQLAESILIRIAGKPVRDASL